MALLKAGKGALRMDMIDDDVAGRATGDQTHIRITFGPGWYNDLYGACQFDQFGRIVGGTLTGVSYTLNDKSVYTLTGATTPAKPFFDLIGDGDATGARELVLSGDDTVAGKNRNDTLFAYNGDDKLKGGGGDDVLVGGVGADQLEGGAGADTFRYFSIADTSAGKLGRDRILDFSSLEGDKIDLTAINAVADSDFDTAFTVVDAFTKDAGQLVIGVADGGYLVRGDTDGDGKADFGLTVLTDGPLTGADFLL